MTLGGKAKICRQLWMVKSIPCEIPILIRDACLIIMVWHVHACMHICNTKFLPVYDKKLMAGTEWKKHKCYMYRTYILLFLAHNSWIDPYCTSTLLYYINIQLASSHLHHILIEWHHQHKHYMSSMTISSVIIIACSNTSYLDTWCLRL